MPKILKKKGLVSFAVIIDVDVDKPCTDGEAKKVGAWLAKYLEMPDHAYDIAPVKIKWKNREAEQPLPIRVRVAEFFN